MPSGERRGSSKLALSLIVSADHTTKATCTCPGGHTTRDLRHTSGGQQGFFFPAAVCAPCPLRAQCAANVASTGGRTITLHPQEALLQQARDFQASAAFDEVRRRRQAVEHRIARVVQLGLRQSRYVGRP